MNRMLSFACVAILAACFADSAAAGNFGAEIVFTDSEITAIRAWYRDNPDSYHQGHGKKTRNGLPPGIAKNLARGKPLPPGIAKQVLPAERVPVPGVFRKDIWLSVPSFDSKLSLCSCTSAVAKELVTAFSSSPLVDTRQ